LIGINAYHQPGVEAGKKAAAIVLDLQKAVAAELSYEPRGADEIAARVNADPETVQLLLEHLAANRRATRTVAGFSA
jgi:glucose-6-phosphate isomerase